jgi:hypothetical protein
LMGTKGEVRMQVRRQGYGFPCLRKWLVARIREHQVLLIFLVNYRRPAASAQKDTGVLRAELEVVLRVEGLPPRSTWSRHDRKAIAGGWPV